MLRELIRLYQAAVNPAQWVPQRASSWRTRVAAVPWSVPRVAWSQIVIRLRLRGGDSASMDGDLVPSGPSRRAASQRTMQRQVLGVDSIACIVGVAALLVVTSAARASCQSISGTVEDSLLGQGPLSNATLWIQDTATRVRTDRTGRFRIDRVAPGIYSLSFSHASFDSAGITLPRWRVTVPTQGLRGLVLATPSPRALFG